MSQFLTADLHLGHANIIRYCSRPFKSLEHMNGELIRRWNERVTDDDTVFIVGDFCFKNSSETKGEGQKVSARSWMKLLNGNKICIRGNHDKNNSLKTIVESVTVKFGGNRYYLCHRPQDCNLNFDINFVGHIHERWHYRKIKDTYLINVGVDVNNFMPKTIEEHLKAFNHYRKNNAIEEYLLDEVEDEKTADQDPSKLEDQSQNKNSEK